MSEKIVSDIMQKMIAYSDGNLHDIAHFMKVYASARTIGIHHTYKNVDGLDYQILLEADFLVNADESNMTDEAISSARENIFKTNTGISLLDDIYLMKRS